MTELEASLIVALTICYHVIELKASLIVTLTICYHVIECDIVWLILLSWGCLVSSTFFFCCCCSELFLLAHHKRKLKIGMVPQNRRLLWSCGASPLAYLYIGEKGRTLGKTYGIKARCYWEHPWGTHWELEGNMLGTKEKLKKPSPHTPTQNFLECMLQPTHWLHVFLISKTIRHHFWPGLTAGAELNKEEKQKI